ncbi:phage head-tail connector protein [Streptomyces sp. PA03-6a]|nr:phage head-tail connector protein [Streptomyces sp. PA03-6a]
MAGEYASLDVLKQHLNIPVSDTTRDQLLTSAIAAASKAIDRDTGRRFSLDSVASQRVYNPSGRRALTCEGELLIVDDIGSATGLIVETGSAGSWTTVTDYETSPENALARGFPVTALLRPSGSWGSGAQRVRVTARWGWPSVPDEVVMATLIQATRLYKRADTPEGVMGSAEWGVVRLARIDPDVYALTKHYILPGF